MVDRAGKSGVTDSFQAPAFDTLPTESVDAEEVKRALAEVRAETADFEDDTVGRAPVDRQAAAPANRRAPAGATSQNGAEGGDEEPVEPTRLVTGEQLRSGTTVVSDRSKDRLKNRLLMAVGIVLLLLAVTVVVAVQSATKKRESIVIRPENR